jgi:uncharacterized LabA/DUF88 family protein
MGISSNIKDDAGDVVGYNLAVTKDTSDKDLDALIEPFRGMAYAMRAFARKKYEERKGSVPIHPIFSLFKGWEKYGKVSIIADGQQQFFAQTNMIESGKLRDYTDPIMFADILSTKVSIVYKSWATGVKEEKQAAFAYAMKSTGWAWHSVPVTKNNDTEVGNVDHKVSDEILSTVAEDKPDTIILLAGDKDYLSKVRSIKALGIRAVVVSLKGMTNQDMLEEADVFVDMMDLAPHIIKERPLLDQAWWQKCKLDPRRLRFLSQEEKDVMTPVYEKYMLENYVPPAPPVRKKSRAAVSASVA